MSRPSVLMVDDQPKLRAIIGRLLDNTQIDSQPVDSLNAVRSLLKRKGFDLCLTALKLPDGSGLDLVRTTQKGSSSLPVAVMAVTGHNGAADLALKHEAFDFRYKQFGLIQLQKLVERVLKTATYAKVERRSRHRLLGDSFAMREIRSSQLWSNPRGTHGKRIFRAREG